MYLLDTNVVSELRKVRAGKADARVAAWADSVEASDLYLSVITLQEIAIGVLLAERRDPVQGAVLRTWFKHQVLPAFDGRVLQVDTAVALRSAAHNCTCQTPTRCVTA
jgi:predicted nucleic acid-binding protein